MSKERFRKHEGSRNNGKESQNRFLYKLVPRQVLFVEVLLLLTKYFRQFLKKDMLMLYYQ